MHGTADWHHPSLNVSPFTTRIAQLVKSGTQGVQINIIHRGWQTTPNSCTANRATVCLYAFALPTCWPGAYLLTAFLPDRAFWRITGTRSVHRKRLPLHASWCTPLYMYSIVAMFHRPPSRIGTISLTAHLSSTSGLAKGLGSRSISTSPNKSLPVASKHVPKHSRAKIHTRPCFSQS